MYSLDFSAEHCLSLNRNSYQATKLIMVLAKSEPWKITHRPTFLTIPWLQHQACWQCPTGSSDYIAPYKPGRIPVMSEGLTTAKSLSVSPQIIQSTLFLSQLNSHCSFRSLVRIKRDYHPFIHPFSTAQSFGRVAGGLEPIPAVFGREAGYTLDRSPVHHRAGTIIIKNKNFLPLFFIQQATVYVH